jgi:hypothetical protein
MSIFFNYPVKQQVEQGQTLYADILNHCANYQSFVVADSKVTSSHELTHGCNSDIRNAAGGKVNGFYVGQDRAIVIPELNCRKSDVAQYVPSSLQSSRFSLYVTGQTEWDDSPLYIYDEFVAYTNGAWAALTLKRLENYVESGRIVDGPVEFVSYGAAVLMAADKANSLSQVLVDFSNWLFRHAYNSYFECLKDFPAFDEQDKLYQEQKNGSSWETMRNFLKVKIGYDIPSGYEDEDSIDWDV